MTQQTGPWMSQWTWPAFALTQPINPGWTFGNVMVTMQNSSAPGIEHAIASKVSYGRQIGRMMDAVEVLVAKAAADVRKLPADAPERKAFADFTELVDDVRTVKQEAQALRVERLKDDLDTLKREDPQGWNNLMKGLRP